MQLDGKVTASIPEAKSKHVDFTELPGLVILIHYHTDPDTNRRSVAIDFVAAPDDYDITVTVYAIEDISGARVPAWRSEFTRGSFTAFGPRWEATNALPVLRFDLQDCQYMAIETTRNDTGAIVDSMVIVCNRKAVWE